jgi:enoyl-CoA hydratase
VIERDDDGDVAVLRLAHGAVSAMDLELCEAVGKELRALADEPARAVVLTGTGKAFSAGVDLRRIVDGGPEYVAAFLPALSEMFRAAFELPKPVVAAVNGHAIAGGCVLAATADTVLMAEGNGRIGVPEIRVGVAFPRVPLEVMRFAVGEVAARRLILDAQTHLPADARALGLVHEVVPAEELPARARAVAHELVSAAPADTFAATKTQLRRETVERMDRYADDDERVEQVWVGRATDGWLARYLESVTKR